MTHSTFFTEVISLSCISLKTLHRRKLHYSLGHPNNSLQLEALCQEEIKRQKDQTDGVHLNTKMLQVTVKPLLNVNINVAFGKEGVFWIQFSTPSKGNSKIFSVLISRQQMPRSVSSLCISLVQIIDTFLHKMEN